MSLVFSAAQWAEQQFGSVQLGDKRRTQRAVKVAAAMAADPSASIPRQSKRWKDTKGAYRLFDAVAATFGAMIEPHWQQTRVSAEQCSLVLLIQDTTELDYTSHPSCQGLGRFGRGGRATGGLGMLLHNVLAVEPLGDHQARVLGLAWNKLWTRDEPVPAKRRTPREQRTQGCESDRWIEAAQVIGGAAPASRFVHVGDREADIFRLYHVCQSLLNVSFLVRVKQTRRGAIAGHRRDPHALKSSDRPETTLRAVAESMSSMGGKSIWIPARGGRPGRWAKCMLSGGAVTLYSPIAQSRTADPLCCWVVRVWEIDAAADVEPIEWLLLSDQPVRQLSDALQRCEWYTFRWMIEQYHQCLKSGCKVEQRQLEHVERLRPLIGMLAVVAVRLLQLKSNTRVMPQAKAIEHVPRESVATLAALLKVSPDTLTLRRFTHEVAKLGGFIGRKSDGDPGWLTLWRGWRELDLITLGTRLPTTTERRCG
jgi:hypothetical protein